MPDKTFLDRLHTHLFDKDLPATFDKDEQEMIIRYRALYTLWWNDPLIPKRDLVNFIKTDFKVSEATAYRDVANVELLLGNVTNASKEFYRHAANELLKEATQIIQRAQKPFEIKKAEALIKVANGLVEINRLKLDEGDDLRWKDIEPVDLEVTRNVEEIGMKRRIPEDQVEETKRRLRKKYFDDAEDVEFEQLDNEEQESISE